MTQVKKWRLVFACLLTLWACSLVQAQDRTIVISGSVVTPEKILNKGWVVIKHKKISAVSETLPNEENAIWVDTNDIIFPGFIDLHNHPMYAMFESMGRRGNCSITVTNGARSRSTSRKFRRPLVTYRMIRRAFVISPSLLKCRR